MFSSSAVSFLFRVRKSKLKSEASGFIYFFYFYSHKSQINVLPRKNLFLSIKDQIPSVANGTHKCNITFQYLIFSSYSFLLNILSIKIKRCFFIKKNYNKMIDLYVVAGYVYSKISRLFAFPNICYSTFAAVHNSFLKTCLGNTDVFIIFF